jgi:dihydropteroate synthase
MPRGSRPGELRGGRERGVSRNIATRDAKIAIEDLAKSYAPAALRALVRVVEESPSHAAVVSAAAALLDRGYGRPRQALEVRTSSDIRALSDEELEARINAFVAADILAGRIVLPPGYAPAAPPAPRLPSAKSDKS